MECTKLLLPAFLTVAFTTACEKQSDSGNTQSGLPVIGVSLLTMANPFFIEMGNAIKDEASKHGYDVIMTAGEFDPAKQQNQVSDFVVKKVAAILLCPTDSKAIGTSIAKANEAGIPVFTADIACLAEGAKVVSHIATDNYQAGRLAAQAVIEALQGAGKVGIIGHPEVESAFVRVKGFEDEVREQKEKSGLNLELVAKLAGSGVKDKSFKAAEDMLQAHQDLKGIFAVNDPTALGAVAAIEKAGRAGQIKVVGIDGQPEGLQAIKEGKIYADVIQHPDKIGAKAVETIVKYMKGEQVPPTILIAANIYRQQDAVTP
ncbi:MAG: substrate-binding domain-containing protein [bacterium]